MGHVLLRLRGDELTLALLTATAFTAIDSIHDLGARTPYEGAYPVSVGAERTVEEPQRWVQSYCVFCSNGCGIDVGVREGRTMGDSNSGGVAERRVCHCLEIELEKKSRGDPRSRLWPQCDHAVKSYCSIAAAISRLTRAASSGRPAPEYAFNRIRSIGTLWG